MTGRSISTGTSDLAGPAAFGENNIFVIWLFLLIIIIIYIFLGYLTHDFIIKEMTEIDWNEPA